MSTYTKELANLAVRIAETTSFERIIDDPIHLLMLQNQVLTLGMIAKEVLKEENQNELE